MLEQKYYACTVQLYNDKNYTTNITLSNHTYRLDFRYNSFSGLYHFSVFDSAGRILAANKEIDFDRFFEFKTYDAEYLVFSFNKVMVYRDINYDRWSDNMFCIARLTKWEKVPDNE